MAIGKVPLKEFASHAFTKAEQSVYVGARHRCGRDARRLFDGRCEFSACAVVHATFRPRRSRVAGQAEGSGCYAELLGELVRSLPSGDAAARSDAQAI